MDESSVELEARGLYQRSFAAEVPVLQRLGALRQLLRHLDGRLPNLVREAHAEGASWEAIGAVLAITKQSAHARFGPRSQWLGNDASRVLEADGDDYQRVIAKVAAGEEAATPQERLVAQFMERRVDSGESLSRMSSDEAEQVITALGQAGLDDGELHKLSIAVRDAVAAGEVLA